MPKQSGIHQIVGRVGDTIYYRQAGVRDGLIRKAYLGASERVKTAPEYANTRLNAAEFGAASMFSRAALTSNLLRWRGSLEKFAQAHLSRSILALIKDDTTSPWGRRGLVASQLTQVLDAINQQAKQPLDNYLTMDNLSKASGEMAGAYHVSTDQMQYLYGIGADGMLVRIIPVNLNFGKFNTSLGKYVNSYSEINVNEYSEDVDEADSYDFEDITLIFPTPPTTVLQYQAAVIMVMPYKSINNQKHTLQEYCTFKYVELPASV